MVNPLYFDNFLRGCVPNLYLLVKVITAARGFVESQHLKITNLAPELLISPNHEVPILGILGKTERVAAIFFIRSFPPIYSPLSVVGFMNISFARPRSLFDGVFHEKGFAGNHFCSHTMSIERFLSRRSDADKCFIQ